MVEQPQKGAARREAALSPRFSPKGASPPASLSPKVASGLSHSLPSFPRPYNSSSTLSSRSIPAAGGGSELPQRVWGLSPSTRSHPTAGELREVQSLALREGNLEPTAAQTGKIVPHGPKTAAAIREAAPQDPLQEAGRELAVPPRLSSIAPINIWPPSDQYLATAFTAPLST